MGAARHVGIIGLGLAGSALAKRFLSKAFRVSGYDIDPSANDSARDLGVAVATDPRDLVANCDVILLSLLNADVIREALWGARGIAPACRAGSIILDTSTTDPDETREHGDRLGRAGVRFVDVSLVGPSDMIARGEALALIGDTESGAAPYFSVLESISGVRYFLGGRGAGNSAKLAVNLVQGLNRLVLAEGLALAARLGLDPEQALAVFKASTAYSKVMDIKGRRMLEGDYQPAARLAQHAKDVGLILTVAERCGAIAPLSSVHAEILAKAIEAGWGDLDNSAVMKVFQTPK